MGVVRYLFRKPASNEPMVRESSLELVADKGIVGDKSFGSSKRQVLIVEEEVLNKYSLSPGDLRENIVSSDLQLSNLEADTLLRIGDTILNITSDCAPCSYIDELQNGLQEEIKGNRGVLAIVQTGSIIRVGDPIQVLRNGD